MAFRNNYPLIGLFRCIYDSYLSNFSYFPVRFGITEGRKQNPCNLDGMASLGGGTGDNLVVDPGHDDEMGENHVGFDESYPFICLYITYLYCILMECNDESCSCFSMFLCFFFGVYLIQGEGGMVQWLRLLVLTFNQMD